MFLRRHVYSRRVELFAFTDAFTVGAEVGVDAGISTGAGDAQDAAAFLRDGATCCNSSGDAQENSQNNQVFEHHFLIGLGMEFTIVVDLRRKSV